MGEGYETKVPREIYRELQTPPAQIRTYVCLCIKLPLRISPTLGIYPIVPSAIITMLGIPWAATIVT